jgi:hypothetical protein
MSKHRISESEGAALIAKMGDRATIGPKVGDKLAEIAATMAKQKSSVNRNAMQDRRPTDRYKSYAERDYAALLDADLRDGIIERWAYEPMGLRIDDGTGKNCVFWPDFCVWLVNGQREYREIKGKGKHAVTPQARTKFLAAKRLFPEDSFRMIQRTDSGWEEIL